MTVITAATLVLPLIYIIFGTAGYFHPPVKLYRIIFRKHMKDGISSTPCEQAGHSFAVVCLFMGIYMFFASLLADAILKYFSGRLQIPLGIALICIQFALLVIPVYYTENKLKSLFDENGDYIVPSDPRDYDKQDDEWNSLLDDQDGSWEKWSSYDDEWVDWDTWLRNRDAELYQERIAGMNEDIQQKGSE